MSENNLGATEIQKAYRAWQKKKRAKAAFDKKMAAMKKREKDIEQKVHFLLGRVHAAVRDAGGCGMGVWVFHIRQHRGREVEIVRGDFDAGAKVSYVSLDKGKVLAACQFRAVAAMKQLEALEFIKPEDKFVIYTTTDECLVRRKKGWRIIK